MDIALVTCAELPDLFPDDRPLARALAAAGLEVAIVRWDDPDFDWGSTQIAMLRSPWDYFHRAAQFLAWAERAAAVTRLVVGALSALLRRPLPLGVPPSPGRTVCE